MKLMLTQALGQAQTELMCSIVVVYGHHNSISRNIDMILWIDMVHVPGSNDILRMEEYIILYLGPTDYSEFGSYRIDNSLRIIWKHWTM